MNISRTMPIIAVGSVAAALSACGASRSTDKPPETTASETEKAKAEGLDRMNQAAQVVSDFGQKIPARVSSSARCVVAIPSMFKGGLIVGGQSGKGYASCQTASGWSAPAPVSIAGGTFGAQVGAQSTDLLALVTTEKGATALSSGNFKVGVDASASAGPVGTGRGSATTDVVSYSRAEGLYAGAELTGTTINLDEKTTQALYGSIQPLSAILDGRVQVPSDPTAERFLSALRAHFGPGRGASKPGG